MPIISFFCLFLFIAFFGKIKTDITKSVFFCLETIIPSIFPVLTFSFLIQNLSLGNSIEKRFEWLTLSLFGLSGNTLKAIITGLTGGYNISTASAVRMLKNNEITSQQAKRMAMFFSSPGLSFCVSITGLCVYNSASIGLKLFFSGIISDILLAVIYNRIHPDTSVGTYKNESKPLSYLFVQSVSSCTNATISICFTIILFSAIKAVFNLIVRLHFFTVLSELFAEVSSGVIYSSSNFGLKTTAFCLYFGGICIFLQQLPDIISLDIKPFYYLIIRIFRALSGTLVFSIIIRIFPSDIPVFNNYSGYRLFSANPYGSLALLFLCVIFIFSTEKIRGKPHNSSAGELFLQ